mgnify:FL=1
MIEYNEYIIKRMKKIIILQDHNGYTTTSLKNSGINKSVDANKIKGYLEKMGYQVCIVSLHTIDNEKMNSGDYIYYPSSEDQGLFYKGYIGDTLMALSSKGLILLPDYKYFQAHHNKVLMELLREGLSSESLKTIKSRSIYDIRDLRNNVNNIEKIIGYPIVLKTASGSGASGVSLARNRGELFAKAKKMGRIFYHNATVPIWKTASLSKIKNQVLKIIGKPHMDRTYPREKVVLQSFIPNLQYDYKVLVYGEKYYVLKRLIRDNDFRASGSGKLVFPTKFDEEIKNVLDMARTLFLELDVPMLSVDIAYDGKKCHMIEFQCVSFGPYTIQFSNAYYIFDNARWAKVFEDSELEKEISTALDYFIRRHGNE